MKHGECLIQAVKAYARIPESHYHDTVQEEAEGDVIWDKATTSNTEFYGWVAAESTVVKLLRRYLIGACGVEHKAINFMAYWSKGRA